MNTLLVIAFVSMIIGFILTFIGVVFYEKFLGESSQPWWVWFLIIIGSILTVGGALITVLMLGKDSDPNSVNELTRQGGDENVNMNSNDENFVF